MRGMVLWSVMFLSFAGEVAIARQQVQFSVSSPRVVAYGIESSGEKNVREVDIAAGGGLAMVVYIKNGREIGFAFFDGNDWGPEGTVDSGVSWEDPSVAYATMTINEVQSGSFVCVYKGGGSVRSKQFDRATGKWTSLVLIRSTGSGPSSPPIDKPWLVAGAPNPSTGNQILHVTWVEDGLAGNTVSHGYSTDGGASWSWTNIIVEGSTIGSRFAVQPTINADSISGPMYAGYFPAGPGFKFLEANYVPVGSPPVFLWVFGNLFDGAEDLTVVVDCDLNDNSIPGPFRVSRVPYLVVDPTNPDQLFLIYNDLVANPDPVVRDVDVLCRKLTRSGSTWTAQDPVRVNDDTLLPFGDTDSDQFIVAAAVDAQGRLQTAFYDDRRFNQLDTVVTGAKFDLYYAVSLDGGATFTNVRLSGIPADPILDFGEIGGVPITSNAGGTPFTPGEYPGLASDGDKTWIAWAGTSLADDLPDKSVIFVAWVEFE